MIEKICCRRGRRWAAQHGGTSRSPCGSTVALYEKDEKSHSGSLRRRVGAKLGIFVETTPGMDSKE